MSSVSVKRNIDNKPVSPPPLGSKIVNEYNYINEHGEVTYQVLRFEPKTFKQRHFKDGKTVWGLKDIEPLPYNLPKILEDKDKTIFIVEGEKDADKLNSLGFFSYNKPLLVVARIGSLLLINTSSRLG